MHKATKAHRRVGDGGVGGGLHNVFVWTSLLLHLKAELPCRLFSDLTWCSLWVRFDLTLLVAMFARRFRCAITLVSLWFHFNSELVLLWIHVDCTSTSLRCHLDSTSVSPCLHFECTTISHCVRFGFTLISLWSRCFPSISHRIHFKFTSISDRVHCGVIWCPFDLMFATLLSL